MQPTPNPDPEPRMAIQRDPTVFKSVNLSVVIIARNEEKNIARAIESVLQAVEHWPRTEILLVDSASTDTTVEIAQRYPINIVRLDPSWFLSVAAGRHIGMVYSRGELTLHMDGDMELDPNWVDRSVSYALEHPDVAVVGGYWRNVYMHDGKAIGEEDQRHDPQDRVLEVDSVCGVMLCRRSAVLQVGGFQPFIKGEEDVELCMSLRLAGYKVIRLPYLACRHYCIPDKSLAGSLRRLRLNMWLGYGQVPRYHLGTSLFWRYLKLNSSLLVYSLGVLISFVTLVFTVLSKNVYYFGSWMLIVVMAILLVSIKKHSLRKALMSLLIHTLITCSALRGFMMAPRSATEYPTNAEIVQVRFEGGNLQADGRRAAEPV